MPFNAENFVQDLSARELSELKEAIHNNIFSELLQGLDGNDIDEIEEELSNDPYISMIDTYQQAFQDNNNNEDYN